MTKAGKRFDHTALILVLLLAAMASLAVYTFPREQGTFPIDDAYIHWVYADNMARGDGFSFNTDEPSMGTSSPVFVLVGTLFIFLGLDYYTWTILFSSLLFIGSAILIFLIIRLLLEDFRGDSSLPWRNMFAFMGASLFAANGNYLWYVLAGMETSLFVFLGLMGLYLYLVRGWDPLTGVVIGLLFWVRITGVSLAFVLFLSDLLRRKFNWRGYLATVLTLAPCIALSLHVSGNVLPTGVNAKKITYIDGEWSPERFFHFFRSIYDYLGNVPAFRIGVLLVTGWLAALPVAVFMRKRAGSQKALTSGAVFIVASWGAVHVAMYGLTFRTLLHHLRYLAVIYPVIAVLSACAAFSLRLLPGGRILRHLGAGIMACLLILSVSNIPFWSRIYMSNIRHIREAYVPTARWLASHTPPEARVAAFDIGLIKHLSGRYVIDLGGLVDPRVHPYLEEQRTGEYLRENNPDYLVYSREPDCDIFTGLYFAEYEGDWRLKQSLAAYFSTDHYSAPTVTHSTRLEIFQVEGWVPGNRAHSRQLFVTDNPNIQNPSGKFTWNGVSFLGYSLEPDSLYRSRQIAQCLKLTLYWTAEERIDKPFWVKISFENVKGKRVYEKLHIPTHNRYPTRRWRKGETIRDHHVIWLGREWEADFYYMYVSLDWRRESMGVDPSGLKEIGYLTVEESPMRPVKMKWKKLK